MKKQLSSGSRSRSAKKNRAAAVRAHVVKITYERTFEEGISPREFATAAKLFSVIQTLARAIIAARDTFSMPGAAALLVVTDLISEGEHYCRERSSRKLLLVQQRKEGQ